MQKAATSNLRKVDFTLIGFIILGATIFFVGNFNHQSEGATKMHKNEMAMQQPDAFKSFEDLLNNLPGQYVVKKDDTMYSIAKKYGINAQQLYAMNDMPYGGIIRPGELLNVPKK